MTTERDDHLPPPAPAREKGKRAAAPATAAAPPRALGPWADRLLFASVGLLAGFAAAYLYIDRIPPALNATAATDPHAGVPGVGPGATRDLPGSGGAQPSLAADPVAQRKLADLEAAAAKEPGNYGLLVQLGNTAYDLENWQKAVDAYERALKLQGGDPNVMTDLGVAYRNTGNGTKALEYFGKALAKDPAHWPAAFNQAIVYGVDRGDKAKAKEILKRIKKEHPEVKSVDGLLASLDQKG
ncbi:MAG: tetratricopeptide repeat protein [Acidobacteriota bacterium]